MLQQVRLRDIGPPEFADAWNLYERVFPFDERRSLTDHETAMLQEDDFVCLALYHNNRFVGLIFYWLLSGCVFVEHLAIVESSRGRGLGSTALNIVKQHDRPIILEIEPPADAVSTRRLRFYESAGFVLLPQVHYQLPYQRGGLKLRLFLMSYPCMATDACIELFEKEYLERIMIYSES